MRLDVFNETSRAQGNQWPGLFFGRVDSVDDPQRINRVRVRVWGVHGGPEDTSPEALPWAVVSTLGGGGYDHGDANSYIVGADVLIGFAHGDPRNPVVIGGFHGSAASQIEMLTVGGAPDDEQTWMAPTGSTLPQDVFDGKTEGDNHPTRKVLHKSYKGHTILIEDKDGEEFLKIIDRAGQVVEMSCPVTEEANANNAEQRGTRDTLKGDQVGHDKMVGRQGYIRIRDLSGQEVVLDARDGNESVTVTSQDRAGVRKQSLTLSSKIGEDYVEVRDAVGNRVTLSAWGTDQVELRSQSGATLKLTQDGNIEMVAPGKIATTATNGKQETWKQNVETTYEGDFRERTLGNRFLGALGTLAISVGGMMEEVIQGARRIVIANAALVGPQVEAWSVKALTGNINLQTLLGSFRVQGGNLVGGLLGWLEIGVDGGATLQSLTSFLKLLATGSIQLSNGAGTLSITPSGTLSLTSGGTVASFDSAGGATVTAGASTITMSPLGFISINGGVIPCNNLPVCLFAGVPHGTNPTLMVP